MYKNLLLIGTDCSQFQYFFLRFSVFKNGIKTSVCQPNSDALRHIIMLLLIGNLVKFLY